MRLVDAGGDGDGLAPGALPPPLHERFPAALQSPRAVVDVLSQVRAERAGQAAPSAFPFHAREVTERKPRHDKLVLDADAARDLVTRGAGVRGVRDRDDRRRAPRGGGGAVRVAGGACALPGQPDGPAPASVADGSVGSPWPATGVPMPADCAST